MISFIIPTLNEEKAVTSTLKCLRAYTGSHEIIVSDGKSKDNTAGIARTLADTVVVFGGDHRQTIAEGKNDGSKAAKGDILVFLDSDVTIPHINTFFEKALALFNADPNLVSITVSYKVLPELETWADRVIFWCVGVTFYLMNDILKTGGSSGEFQMVRAEKFRAIGGFNQTLVVAEDNDLFWRLRKLGRTHCERSLVIYHTGRRAHKIGWPKLLFQWFSNFISAAIFKKSTSSEWVDIR